MAAGQPKWVPLKPVLTFEDGFLAEEEPLKRRVQ